MPHLLPAAAPDPGDPSFPTFVGAVGGTLFTAAAILRKRPRREVEWAGFAGAFLGVSIGLVVYLAVLMADLY
jgi:hypothetical protein